LTDANVLPEIVLGACREESLMDSLQKTIAPLYQTCIKNHAGGRFEQHCRSVYAECAARNITVQSSLPPDRYDQTIEHQVDGLAYCMDLKQAKALANNECYMPINRTTKLSSYMERPVTQEQITKCMKRMERLIAERMFLENGCQYKSSERFTKESFHLRWKEFVKRLGLKKFSPWNRLDKAKKDLYSTIPDGAKIRAQETSKQKRIAKLGCGLITRELIGKTVEVQLGGKYQKVKILNVMNRGKVVVESEDGFKMAIKETDKWRTIPKGWGKKAEPEKVTPEKKEEPKEVKPTAAVPSPPTVPTTAAVPAPRVLNNSLAVAEPRHVAPQSRAVGGPTSAQPKHQYVLGQMVECTNDPKVQVFKGTVVSLFPLYIRVGQNAPAIFRFVRPLKVESLKCDAVNVTPSQVIRGPTIPTQTNPIQSTIVAPVPAAAPKPVSKFAIGQMVNCTDDPKKEVLIGIVKTLHPLVIQVGNRGAKQYKFVREVKTKEYVLKCSMNVYAYANTRSQGLGYLNAGQRVQVADMKEHFAYIIAPCEGWVVAKNKTRWLMVEAGKKIEKVFPTLIVSGLNREMTGDDLYTKCVRFGFYPVERIRTYTRSNGSRFAEIKFERHGQAESIKTLGLSDCGIVLNMFWKPEYLDYRELAL